MQLHRHPFQHLIDRALGSAGDREGTRHLAKLKYLYARRCLPESTLWKGGWDNAGPDEIYQIFVEIPLSARGARRRSIATAPAPTRALTHTFNRSPAMW